MSRQLHLAAIVVAGILVFGLKIQEWNLQPLLHTHFDDNWFAAYTPYFPGMDNLGEHEIFSPKYRHTKKIVFLGASAIDSTGCDSTWHHPVAGRDPPANAHHSCTVACRLNHELEAAGLGGEWHAFNLARNGTKLTPMLYVLAQISELKPEIVIYGDTYDYYLWENADANELKPEHYAFLDRTFLQWPKENEIWQSYLLNLQKHGWKRPAVEATPKEPPQLSRPREHTSISDFLVLGIRYCTEYLVHEGPPHPILINTNRKWTISHPNPYTLTTRDPGFLYFQGVRLIAALQRQHQGALMFYFSPQFDWRSDPYYQKGLQSVYGGYLAKYHIPFLSLVGLPLKPDYETYDGNHQTVYGNMAIAKALFQDLQKEGLLK